MSEPGAGKWSWEGIELIWVVLGFLGAALGVSRMPPMNKWQLMSSLVSGIVLASQAPQWAAFFYLKWTGAAIPAFMNNTVAFFFGIGGMFIVPGVIVFWQEFGKDPWGAIMRLVNLVRGKPTLPPDSTGDKP